MGQDPPFSEAYWVVPGRLMAGPYPHESRGRLRVLMDAGIRCFVDLTDGTDVPASDEYAPHAASLASRMSVKIRLLSMGYGDMTTPEEEQMIRILDAIDEALEEDLPVYVHCLMGLGRTGTVIGCWLARHRMASGQDAIDHIESLRQDTTTTYYPSPVTDEQEEFVRAWPEGL